MRGANSARKRPTQGVRHSCTSPRGAFEIPPRRHARLDHPPLWRRPQASRSPPVDFSSRSTPVGAVSHVATRSSPGDRGHAGLVRRARTYPWWDTTGQFSPPKPRRTWVTSGLLPACIPGTPRGPPEATGACIPITPPGPSLVCAIGVCSNQ